MTIEPFFTAAIIFPLFSSSGSLAVLTLFDSVWAETDHYNPVIATLANGHKARASAHPIAK